MKKRISCLVALSLAGTLLLSACGGGGTASSKAPEASKAPVFSISSTL